MPFKYDVFISHASEDKDDFVLPLAEALKGIGLRVWYDDFSLKLGDSLRESIDRGLADSRFGIVVLSPNFFAKHWPQQELNGLAAREAGGVKVILPVWHNIDANEVRKSSPMLADKKATQSKFGLPRVVRDILGVVEPELESPEPAPVARAVEAANLDAWVGQSLQRWQQLTQGLPANHHARMPLGHWRIAYALECDKQLPTGGDLRDVVSNSKIRHTGWPLFWVPTRDGIAPYILDGAIECWFGKDSKFEDPAHADLWRVHPSGLFFIMRGYQEDTSEKSQVNPGEWFDVTLPSWRISEAVLHAASVAKSIGASHGQVRMLATWTGLAGRTLTSISRTRIIEGSRYTSRQSEFTANATFQLADVPSNVPSIVDGIVRPLYELFGFFSIPATLTAEEFQKMRTNRFDA